MPNIGKKFYKTRKGKLLTPEQEADNRLRVSLTEEMVEVAAFPPSDRPFRAYYILDGKRRLLGFHQTLEEAVMAVEFLDIAFQNQQDDLLGLPRLYAKQEKFA